MTDDLITSFFFSFYELLPKRDSGDGYVSQNILIDYTTMRKIMELYFQSQTLKKIDLLSEMEQYIHIQEKFSEAVGHTFNVMQKPA